MKRRYHFGNATSASLAEMARVNALISDLDKRAQLLECDLAAEQERARVFNRSDATYPIAARTLAVRRDNLRATIAALEKWLAGLQGRTDKVPAIARQSGWEARDNQDGESVSQRGDDCRDDCRAQEFC
jgi:hypothetical protein